VKRTLVAGAVLLTASLMPVTGQAQGTVKIGVILPYSGQFADTATQIDDGIKLYMQQHGDSVAGKKIGGRGIAHF
jgi:branched-chain amino acid transport system substrate-binding protein